MSFLDGISPESVEDVRRTTDEILADPPVIDTEILEAAVESYSDASDNYNTMFGPPFANGRFFNWETDTDDWFNG